MDSKLDVLKSAIGQRIRSARRARDISQENLAATVGRSTAALSNIERGASLPPLDTLFQIAEALDVPISAFFANIDTGVSTKRVELDAEMAMQLGALRDDQMATALRVVRALRE